MLSALVLDLPIGTNLGLFHILWTLISGRLLQTCGALIPALAAIAHALAGIPSLKKPRSHASRYIASWVYDWLATFQN